MNPYRPDTVGRIFVPIYVPFYFFRGDLVLKGSQFFADKKTDKPIRQCFGRDTYDIEHAWKSSQGLSLENGVKTWTVLYGKRATSGIAYQVLAFSIYPILGDKDLLTVSSTDHPQSDFRYSHETLYKRALGHLEAVCLYMKKNGGRKKNCRNA